jgi:AcrR family transcriptional regulator
MTQIEDRRVRRTRTGLADALTGLIIERGYDRVTVQDILDRADVGRSTFYTHFRDKESLLLSCFDSLRDELSRELGAMTTGVVPPDPRRPSIVLFEHAYRHRRIYQALCGRNGGTIVQRHLHTLIVAALRTHLRPHLAAAGSSIPAEAIAEFYTSALLGLLTWWISQDFHNGPRYIARLYGTLAIPGITAAVTGPSPV